MTGTDYTLFTHKSVPVIFEPPCTSVRCFLYETPYQVHVTPTHMIQIYRTKHGQKKIHIPYLIYRYTHEVSISDSLLSLPGLFYTVYGFVGNKDYSRC
jgi:hypothetical protein